MSKKVLILTVPFGGGHYATASKIASLLHDRDPSIETKVIDVITDGWPAFSRSSSNAYQSSTAAGNAFWFKVYFRLTDRFPNPLKWFGSITFMKYALRKLGEEEPDLIITTFPFIGHVAARARRRLHRKAPIVTVITDAGKVQAIWLTGHEDRILAATPDTVAYAEKRRLGRGRVTYIGFPMDRPFFSTPDTTDARRELGLKEDLFTVLMTSGGLGMSAHKMVVLARQLASISSPFQLVCIAGKNEALQRELEAIDFPSYISVRIIGYSMQMPLLIAASDIVCSKSGWLTITETLAVRRPLFLFDVIPGQEQENAAYVVGHDYGVLETDPVAMTRRIAHAIKDPKSLDSLHDAIARRDDHAAAERLADYLIGLLDGRPV